MTATETATRPADTTPGRAAGHVAVALTVVVALEALRRLFPGVYGVSERSSLAATAAFVVAIAVLPLALLPLRRLTGAATGAWAVGALACWRLAATFGVTSVAFAAVGTVVALVALGALLNEPTPARAWALAGGLAIDLTVVGGAFGSFDPIWRRDAGSIAVGLALSAALAAAAWIRRRPAHDPAAPAGGTGVGGGVAVGAVLTLELLFLANPSFVAAVDVSYSEAVALVALGLLALCAGVALVGAVGRRATLAGAALLAVAGWWLPHARSATAVAVVLVAQLAAGAVLGDALDPAGSTGTRRGDVGLALGWVPLVVGTLLFPLQYDTPLPVDNRWQVALIGALGALAALSRPAPHPMPDAAAPRSLIRWSASVGALTVVAGVIVPAALATTGPDDVAVAPASAATALRVVQWNVHQAVNDDGVLDPDAVARAVRAQGPVDVVVLNEVGRGWPLSGQIDLVTALSRRLDLPFVWAGAASRQFGNAVLSRLPILDRETITLPVAGDAQGRSALHVTLDRGGGRTVDVVATHLQHHNDASSMAARLDEIRVLTARFASSPALVLAGDLNPRQGDPPAYPVRRPDTFDEVRALLTAGFTTAADLTACATPSSGRNCSDYVFAAGALAVRSVRVVDGGAFDHRLLVADVVDR